MSAVVTPCELRTTSRSIRCAGYARGEYLARCAADPEALLVKRADLADKDFRDDVGVPLAAAQRLRRRAKERLALLDQLADWTHR